jgi:hypothetical protein
VGAGKLSPGAAKVAHLTGSRKFELKPAQREELKRYVEAGGTLVVDAVGGSSAFAEAALRELGETFGESAATQLKTSIPLTDPLYTNPADPIKRVGYRQAAMSTLSGDAKSPRLRGIRFGKRLGVIFSREDLSTGLVGNEVDGVIGYDPPSAMALMRNIILQASNITKKPKILKTTGPVGDGLE